MGYITGMFLYILCCWASAVLLHKSSGVEAALCSAVCHVYMWTPLSDKYTQAHLQEVHSVKWIVSFYVFYNRHLKLDLLHETAHHILADVLQFIFFRELCEGYV